MRRFILALLLLATAAPASAAGLFDQYVAARDAFVGSNPDSNTYLQQYRTKLFAGIEGSWFPLTAVAPAKDDPEVFKRLCERLPYVLTLRDAYSFNFVLKDTKNGDVPTIFASRGGNAFGSFTDPGPFIHRLGLDAKEGMDAPIQGALNAINGIATIVRPSPDILVIQTNYGLPQIFGRCPA